MDVSYPIKTSATARSEGALLELLSKVRTEATGHYLLSEGGRWHGGIHITERSHPNHPFEPIRALADGELVAYRMTEDYLQSSFQGQTLHYSNSFCLLRHRCPVPDTQDSFTFYSLYMHLRPLNYQPGPLYRVKSTRNTRRAANPAEHSGDTQTLAAGSLIECLSDPAEQHSLGGNDYLFVKARTYNPENGDVGEPFWVALHEKNSPAFYTDGFEVQSTFPRWYPQPRITPPQDNGLERFQLTSGRNIRWASPPYLSAVADATLPTGSQLLRLDDAEVRARLGQDGAEYTFHRYRILSGENKGQEGWMAFDAASFSHMQTQAIALPAEQQPDIRTDQLVVLETPIAIRAGDALGYLGLHERLCREGDGSVEHSHQIHLEAFAVEPPPQALFNSEHWRWMSQGDITDHEANPKADNGFFKNLLTSLDDNEDEHLSHGEVQQAYRNDEIATSLEHLLSLHTNEWHDDANRAHYKWWEIYLGQVHAWARGQDERQAFYEKLQDNLEHERERLTHLKWLDAAQGRLGLTKDVWHMHPIRLVSQLRHEQRYIDVEDFILNYDAVHQDKDRMGWYDLVELKYINLDPFGETSKNNLRDFLNAINTVYYDYFDEFNVYYLAYILATARLESYDFTKGQARGFFDPGAERLGEQEANINYGGRLGNNQPGDGYRFRGRGYCQLTGRDNYERLGSALNVDLVTDPTFASDPELATRIILLGMKDGRFTGRSLSRYLDPKISNFPDYVGARGIINPGDKPEIIARDAREFQKLLEEGL
ncbi:hypothetical protein [Aliidiomarina soli]|uniref:Glycoside hydrolase family 19 catalytic domain-containing protein n=1 Tax=Aliidiomarina soli TaxID=1928574 RepID=A0A432WJ56_9GAMM|nr:hypothetical protein [Aliidiomarina soli]RUO33751.1 hypothetical protein CWE14_04605 [Aliidiomarina soli]